MLNQRQEHSSAEVRPGCTAANPRSLSSPVFASCSPPSASPSPRTPPRPPRPPPKSSPPTKKRSRAQAEGRREQLKVQEQLKQQQVDQQHLQQKIQKQVNDQLQRIRIQEKTQLKNGVVIPPIPTPPTVNIPSNIVLNPDSQDTDPEQVR